MPITINGSGTVTGISAGGLPDGCVTGDDIANNAVTVTKLGTTEQSQLCKAWVNFNGTGVVAIRASYNVSSITDTGVGRFTVNFTSALPDTNYAVVYGINWDGDNNSGFYNLQTTSVQVASRLGSGTDYDYTINTVAIFR